jgi:hypothetical protein
MFPTLKMIERIREERNEERNATKDCYDKEEGYL